VTPTDVHAMLRDYLRKRSDLGVRNAVAGCLLKPRNPFEPQSIRKPRRWFVLFLIASVTAISAFAYFNFWN
jgi:hypothetical protein